MNNSDVISYETTQEDWEDFFANWDLDQGTTYSLDQDHEWLCVASQHGSWQLKQADQRLAPKAQELSGPPDGYEFDR